MIPAILRGTINESILGTRLKRLKTTEVNTVGANSSEIGPNVALITFHENDRVGGENPYNDAVIVTSLIRSSMNIIFKSVFDKMKQDLARLIPSSNPLFGFSGERRETEGVIALLVT